MIRSEIQLHITQYKATAASAHEPIVLLHGWGFCSESWQPLLTDLQKLADVWTVDLPGFGHSAHLTQFDERHVIAALARQLPEKSCLMGWSLGGVLATKYAAVFPTRVSKLITLASNLCFVEKDHWPSAMLKNINDSLNQQFESAPELTRKKFSRLVSQGSEQERLLVKKIRRMQASKTINKAWYQALTYLSVQDNTEAFIGLTMPGLHLFSEKDVLVPVDAAEKISALNNTQKIEVINNVCHAMHLDNPNAVLESLTQFLVSAKKAPCQRNKQSVARSFSRAATSYDSVAYFQREVGENLFTYFLNDNAERTQQILDLGVGTGHLLADLQEYSSQGSIVALDLAEGMLQVARKKHAKAANWVCGDAETLPFMSKSFDLIYSNLALQWCEDLPKLFAVLYRVLKPGGRIVFSTLNKGTLKELADAWQSVDSYVHVNQFPAIENVFQAIQAAGFSKLESQAHTHPLYYQSFLELARELKALGAHNVNAGRPEGLTTHTQLKKLMTTYESLRTPKGLPLTYEVVYIEITRGEHD